MVAVVQNVETVQVVEAQLLVITGLGDHTTRNQEVET